MLENLDTIPWDILNHAYGKAKDTPGHIRSLASSDPKEREIALDELSYTIIHQGCLWEAAAYAVPFLVELLEHPDVTDKLSPLTLLCEIADGWNRYENDSYDAKILNPDYLVLLRNQLQENLHVYRDLLDSSDIAVFHTAVLVLLYTAQGDEKTHSIVLEKLSVETIAERRVAFLTLLEDFGPRKYAHIFEQYFHTDKEDIVKLVAAVRWARWCHDASQEEITEFLVAFIQKNANDLINRYNSLETAGGYWEEIDTAISIWGPKYTECIIDRFIKSTEANLYSGEQLNALLLTAFISTAGKANPYYLTDVQKKVVRLVAEKAYPEPDMDISHVIKILESFGLPGNRKGIDRMLGLPDDTHPGFSPGERRPWWAFWR
ncbi:MAG: hypothetical protein GY754_37440 [bacterium]|nr:hypothetical protein [bacterium]